MKRSSMLTGAALCAILAIPMAPAASARLTASGADAIRAHPRMLDNLRRPVPFGLSRSNRDGRPARGALAAAAPIQSPARNSGSVSGAGKDLLPASADEAWVERYNGPGNGDDIATAMAVDASGNVYVTGYGIGSGSGQDYATIKYSPSGVQQWVVRYDGPGGLDDQAWAIRADAAGNVYVTGWSQGLAGDYDIATIKYNSNGTTQWVARYDNPDASGVGIAADAMGNVFVTGYVLDWRTGYDYATLRYDHDGRLRWIRQYGGRGKSWDFPYAGIALDASGNVYVSGFTTSKEGDYDFTTIRYNSHGARQWVAEYNGPGGGDDLAWSIAVDASDNVCVTGESWRSGSDYDITTIKYTTKGKEEWIARYNNNADGSGFDVAADASDNVYVTGYSGGWGTAQDFATIKYSSNGIQQWVARYDGAGAGPDFPYAIAVDGPGNACVTGLRTDSAGDYDYATVMYDTDGSEEWVMTYDGPGQGDDVAQAIALDASGNVCVTGWSTSAGGDYDYATIKYSQTLDDRTGPGALPGVPSAKAEGACGSAFSQSGSARARLTLIDAAGRVVTTREVSVARGAEPLALDRHALRAGVYLVRLESRDQTISRKLVIPR